MSKEQEYDVEFRSTTWRVVQVEAKSQEEAEEKAWESVVDDWDISKAWRQNAEVSSLSRHDDDGSWTLIHSDDGTLPLGHG